MAVGILSASLMVLAKRSQPVLTLYGLAASLLAGALFSVDQLPPFLQALSLAIPHTYVINAARTVLMEDPGTFTMSFSTAAIALTVFNLVVFTSGLWLLHRSMQYARKMGMLSGY
jgi:ABC-type polysaccharide/polyol phosphate export permease